MAAVAAAADAGEEGVQLEPRLGLGRELRGFTREGLGCNGRV